MLNNKPRTIGSTGLAIGTHLAMETLFNWIEPYDPERIKPEPVNLALFNCYYFNIYTLARNLANSFEEKDKPKIYGDKEFPELLANEINLLKTLFQHVSSETKLIIYKCDYSKAIKNYNNGKGNLETVAYTDFVMVENHLAKLIDKNELFKNTVVKSNYRLPKPPKEITGTNFLLTTSISFDLLNKGNITLLESHTGKSKKKDQFYTKFHSVGTANLSAIPFTEETLFILGDKFIIKPLNILFRKSLVATAFERDWNYKTPASLVRSFLVTDTDFSQYIFNLNRLYT